MFNWLFEGSEKKYATNDRSVINPTFFLSEEMCTIGIYVYEKRRVVLMESGVGPARTMLSYEGDLEFTSNFDNQPTLWEWTSYTTNNWRDKIGELTCLRNSAKTVIDFQLTVAEFTLFKGALARCPESNSPNPFDDSIHAAAAAIGKTIFLEDLSDDFCCIS